MNIVLSSELAQMLEKFKRKDYALFQQVQKKMLQIASNDSIQSSISKI